MCVVAVTLGACLFPSLDGLGSAVDAASETGVEAAADVDAGLGSYVAEVMADGPASWWRLGESSTSQPAADEMNVQPGAYRTPGITLGAKGAIASDTNTAASYDGTNGSMFLPGTAYDLGGSVPFAIEVWISPLAAVTDDSGDATRRIISHRTVSPFFGWYMLIDGTQSIVFTRWDQNATTGSITSSPIATGTYSHVVVSSDGTTMSIYVNGVESANGPAGSITPNVAASSLAFGSHSDFSSGEWFAGQLDEPAIYTHALTAARVLAHYQAGIK